MTTFNSFISIFVLLVGLLFSAIAMVFLCLHVKETKFF